MPGLEQAPGLIRDQVEIVDPIIKDDQLMCPDGFALNDGADQCIPYKVKQNESALPLWAFVLVLTLILLVFASILFLVHFLKKKMDQRK